MIRTKGPKCKCGCGKRVTKSNIHPSGWNKYLPGHNLKVPLSKEKERQRRNKISKTMIKFLDGNIEARLARASFTGKTHSEAARKIMSEKAYEREIKRKEEGYTVSEEVRQRISRAMKGREILWRDKISKGNKGKTRSEENRQQIASTLQKYYETHENPFKGKQHTIESRKKISEKVTGLFRGENGPNWQGGISSLPYGPDWTPWLREQVRKRDGNKCMICGIEEKETAHDVHHIDFDKDHNAPENLITLCRSCHGKANRNIKVYKPETLLELIND
jgi:hypothetical protein